MQGLERARQIVAEALNVPLDTINESSMFGDPLEWSSAGHMFIVGAVEEAIGGQLENEDVVKLTNIQAIVELLHTRGVA